MIDSFELNILIAGLIRYLNMVVGVDMPPDHYWHCAISIYVAFMAFMCSTLFILSMTFERFYSIIRPHKAVSINTFRKAKISIVCIVIFSIISAGPHLFISSNYDRVNGPKIPFY